MNKLNFKFPFFILLLPFFFVIHTLNENYVPVLVTEALLLGLMYCGIALLLTGAGWLLFRNWRKAGLLTFALMAFNFFFGSTHDYMKKHAGHLFIVKYSFILPAVLLLLIVLIIYLKKTKKELGRISQFINLLFIVLIVLDLVLLFPKIFKHHSPIVHDLSAELVVCDTCAKPDVYLIIADEYAGRQTLTELFSFDNTAFEQALESRGFHIVKNSRSNYNATVYSMASMLNMDYLSNLESNIVNHRDMLRCRGLIQDNQLVNFLERSGYSIFNQSYFEMDDKKKLVYNPFYPTKTALFTAQTFTSRFRRNLGFHFASREAIEKVVKHHLYNNRKIDSVTRQVVMQRDKKPKLVYTHLAMPHHPYYFDSSGKEAPMEVLTDEYKNDKKAYTQYLLYTNKKILSLIDHINANSKQPPIIILVSDHGFRQFPDTVNKNYYFVNFNAIFLPGMNYAGFHEGMSNVNQFRVILNTEFGLKLPLLKDSTYFFEEPLLDF